MQIQNNIEYRIYKNYNMIQNYGVNFFYLDNIKN
jgi:hypothetical protein